MKSLTMGTLTVGTLLLTASVAMAGGLPVAPDLMPVKMLKPPKHAPVELVRKGEPRAVVYVADAAPSANLKILVAELVEAVKLSTGATLPVVTNPPPADQPAIIIGDCDETRKAGLKGKKLPIEGFEVKTAANRVYLVGSTEALPPNPNITDSLSNDGTAWAVADFLERFVGVRWYWPVQFGGRTVVTSAELAVPPAHYLDAPAFRKRSHYPPGVYGGWRSRHFDKPQDRPAPPAAAKGGDRIDMQPVLAGLRAGNSWPYLIKVHQPQGGFPLRDPQWAKEHETMFALNADGTRSRGLLCYSSPKTFDYLIEGAKRAWDDKKGGAPWVTGLCLSISPGDAPVDCHCPDCRKLFDPQSPRYGMASGEASKIMGTFVKKVCEEVKHRWPDKKVIFLPYWNYTICPEEIDFPDNLEIEMCTTGFALFREKEVRDGIEKNLRAWNRKAGGWITSWEYSCWVIDWTHAPLQFPHLVQDYYRANREVLAGSFINGNTITEWSKCAPTLYVWQRVLWNPDINVEATLDEMCARLFGEGAATSRALLRLMCDRWEKSPWSKRAGTGRLAPAIFRETWPAEVVAEMEKLWRQAREEMKDDPVALARFDYWTWTFEAFLKEAGDMQAGAESPPPEK